MSYHIVSIVAAFAAGAISSIVLDWNVWIAAAVSASVAAIGLYVVGPALTRSSRHKAGKSEAR